ncbi:hypothetical protein HPB49_012186 [Dermacentor silvarum]|uniref:Uncharacterized protein n=1 Tax=Dermacentor silvarum TaxID=543639 RepID=A0ACB8C967_DERSI|nr:hypothetical protein HPB49_012186 [Dermacentor silvarum]
MAARIRDINTVNLGAKKYAVATYIAPPANSARGVAHGIPQGTTDAELIRGLYAHRRQIYKRGCWAMCDRIYNFRGKNGTEVRQLRRRRATPPTLPTHGQGMQRVPSNGTDVCPHPYKPTYERCSAAEPSDIHDCMQTEMFVVRRRSCDGFERMPQETATSATLVAQAAQGTGTQKQHHDGTVEQVSHTAIPISDPLQVKNPESRNLQGTTGELGRTLSPEATETKRQNQATHTGITRRIDKHEHHYQALAARVQEVRVEIAELHAQLKEKRSRNKQPVQESSPEPRTPPPPPQSTSAPSVVQENVEEMNSEAQPEPDTIQPLEARVTACERGIEENRIAIQELDLHVEKGLDELRQMITQLHEVITPLVNDQRHKKPGVYPHSEAALQQMLQLRLRWPENRMIKMEASPFEE